MDRAERVYGFQHRLCQAFYHSRLTQLELAGRIGASRPTVAHYLNGDSVPDAYTLARLGIILNVSTDWLLYGDRGRAPDWT